MENWPTKVSIALTPVGEKKTNVRISLTVQYLVDIALVNPVSHQFWVRELDAMEVYARGSTPPSAESYHEFTRVWANREFLGFVVILASFGICAVILVSGVLFGFMVLSSILFLLLVLGATILIGLIVIVYNLTKAKRH